jgi:hypothetical protein
MTGRGFGLGDRFMCSGLAFRVEQGRKLSRVAGETDLLLEVWTGDRWAAVGMELGAMLTQFFYENEQVLYPPALMNGSGEPLLGGQRYLNACRAAIHHGWEAVAQQLEAERRRKNGR